jgi:hypothetical protein
MADVWPNGPGVGVPAGEDLSGARQREDDPQVRRLPCWDAKGRGLAMHARRVDAMILGVA